MDFLEKDLEQIVWETHDDILQRKGLLVFGKRKRQLKIGNYGRADLVTFWRIGDTIHFTVFELKKDQVNIQTLLQSMQYVRGIDTYLQMRGFKTRHHITLIGKSIDTNSPFCYFPNIFADISIYTYKMDINGLSFIKAFDYNLKYKGFDFNPLNDGPF